MAGTYKHKEAFALMWYRCDECGHRERIWNSRDGVTPFGISCPSCGGHDLLHADWHFDDREPDYEAHAFQRFFRDGTADEAVAIIMQRIAHYAEVGNPVPDDVQKHLLAEAREQKGDWDPGWPKIDVCLPVRKIGET